MAKATKQKVQRIVTEITLVLALEEARELYNLVERGDVGCQSTFDALNGIKEVTE